MINSEYRWTTPTPETFNKAMKKMYIQEDNQVVIYNSISAAKAWFIMKYYGHPNTYILDGGISQWSKLKYPINTFKTPMDYSNYQGSAFEAKEPNTDMLASLDDVLEKIGRPHQNKQCLHFIHRVDIYPKSIFQRMLTSASSHL
jgi:thiosulfate/3-mercaptopyruvate sulfurtransferase